ncbi:MAG TPA: cardiolipin synthase, partial [Flavobacteriaceae bacterium]|nr:cardiolipin synthase [Flavobacteriaceae bacterium]
RVRLPFLANRLNYRNHRKIIIIDGTVGFTGGINISDRYINSPNTTPYWRDTYLMLQGLSALALQRVFLSDWNFCSNEPLTVNAHYFPLDQPINEPPIYTQIVSGGPDSDLPNILFTLNSAIQSAQDEILLATPYFIPDATLQENLILAALSGIKVKLLLPEKSDSKTVDLASRSYFDELLQAGVEIYLYTKGFLHSKTFVIDRKIASVGTANLDLRSFDLNFEVTTLIYHQDIAVGMAGRFYEDLKDARQLSNEQWQSRSKLTRFTERIVRLISPLM